MKETQKANLRRVKDDRFQDIFSGNGIDIGGGSDPLVPCQEFPNLKSVKYFDKPDGTAQNIRLYEGPDSYDLVYSSHCLEHLLDPESALVEWASLVKKGGHLVVVVPDEDLYEQGFWPSRNNGAHKFTFAIDKLKSWSLVSINLEQLADTILGFEVVSIERCDTNYDYERMGTGADQTQEGAEANIEMVLRKL